MAALVPAAGEHSHINLIIVIPQVTDAGAGMTESVAQKILELANAGETCPERLCAGALRKLRQ